MNKQIKIDHSIIEYLLYSLEDFPKGEEDIGSLLEKCHSPEFDSFLEQQKMRIAVQLRNFVEEMPGGFFIYHAGGQEELIYANKAMMRICNCRTMEEFRGWTGNSFRGIVYADDLERVEKSIQEQIADNAEELDYAGYRVLPKGGEVRWIDGYGRYIRSTAAGDVFCVFVRDATEKERRQAEEREKFFNEKRNKELLLQNRIKEYDQEMELIHQEHFRRLEVIEGLSVDYEAIFYADLDLDQVKAYRLCSQFKEQFPKTCRFSGFDAAYIQKWVHPEDRKFLSGITHPDYIRTRLLTEKYFHANYRMLVEEEVKYMQLRIVNVSTKEGGGQIILGYRNTNDEMMQETLQKKKLVQALEKANVTNDAKNLFLANMSHDIRTPMNAIVGFVALARQHIADQEKIAGYLEKISDSSEELLRLLNDVLEIVNIESGEIHVEEKECSLMKIAHQVQMNMLPQAALKDITLSLDISRLRHDAVCSDQAKLEQILTYLVDNAIKYTKKGGKVLMAVKEQIERQEDYAIYRFIVEDNGIGISEGFLKHIFGAFEREKNTTLSGVHGTGLGLTIAKELVEMLGGMIDISSEPRKGSKFTITLPIRMQSSLQCVPGEEKTAPVFFSDTKRILVVDDNEINLEIEYEVLKDAGYLVDTAMDGSIAYEKIRQSQPGDYDLILMDIQMPVMDGYHAARAIRELENPLLAKIPIIAVSANSFEGDRKMSMECGMNAHLAKPLDVLRLFKVIHEHLKDTDA